MPNSQPAPRPYLHGLEAWADYLETRALPVRVSILTRFRRLLANDRSTLQQLTHLVSSDPVLSLHVTRTAQQLHQGKRTSVTSIQHAVSSIGLDRLQTLAKELSSLKINPGSMQQKMYFRAIADSLHASFQSAELCRMRGLPFVEEVRLASLLYGFIHWLAWLYAPLHKQHYQERVLLHGVDVALAEQDIFGCTLQALGAELAARWDLPELTRDALSHATSPSHNDLHLLHRRAVQDPSLGKLDMRNINQLTQQRFFPVKLGNWLALTTTRSWHSDKALRLFDILADYLSLTTDRLVSQLHQHCAEAARRYHVAGTLSPAAELIFLPTQDGTPHTGLIPSPELKRLSKGSYPLLEVPPSPAPTTLAEPPAEQEDVARPVEEHLDSDRYRQSLERLTDPQYAFTKPAQVLQTLLQGLHQGLGLQRLALLLVNLPRQQLQCAHRLGLPAEHSLGEVRISLEVPSLFKRLSEKPAGILMDSRNRKKLDPMLPEAFTSRLDQGDYMLMSIFQSSTPVALIYADDLPRHEQLSPFQFEQFRQLCAAASQAMRRLAG
ncbi:HDOD domain-containing protein [Marinobacterium sediminicola]|uniref:HD-like signal output (HDOD) domain, no enzymatic activity n=1 Tax=Marinobacterium sediminicola TaxID=518898 RepID=A0ABY1S3J6_9GAMM|nr:HDOD domain-containing protein [Marinobacterium sediminicola]ULG69874.1 HDOD domain-containing protein [Marinobacterium sediminicola]SMR77846.1 HD-like signal output (HDOD) domain, no enzymatic activity [Marinobacterium sediminicola]